MKTKIQKYKKLSQTLKEAKEKKSIASVQFNELLNLRTEQKNQLHNLYNLEYNLDYYSKEIVGSINRTKTNIEFLSESIVTLNSYIKSKSVYIKHILSKMSNLNNNN